MLIISKNSLISPNAEVCTSFYTYLHSQAQSSIFVANVIITDEEFGPVKIHNIVRSTNCYNYEGERILLPSEINLLVGIWMTGVILNIHSQSIGLTPA